MTEIRTYRHSATCGRCGGEVRQDVCAACIYVDHDRRIRLAREYFRRMLPIVQAFARENPEWHFTTGVKQDPCGVHKLLQDIEADSVPF